MNNATRWFLLLASASAAALALSAWGRSHRARVRKGERASHAESLRDWENEGGTLAPAAASRRRG